MRPIRFRAWDKRINLMFHVAEMFWLNGGLSVDDGASIRPGFAPKDFELMQFTGLLDKNGKEIYEGDILNEKNQLDERATVQFLDGSFVFRAGSEQSPCQKWYIKNNQLEVIGNIYENGELLTSEN